MRFCVACLLLTFTSAAVAADKPYTRQQDIVYGRKHGMALTLDVFTPKEKSNGAAVIWIVSGGWFSSHDAIRAEFVEAFLERGYTVFAVVHGSQPKFTIPEAIADVQRSVRFIRHNAERFKIDPDRIGVMGASAGGHLSLTIGATGDDGNAKAPDEVERASSRVQAVACFFPPTDFLNYGKEGEEALGTGVLNNFKAPFDFHELKADTKTFERITDPKKRREIGKQISPVTHVSADDAPALIIHGDADKLVPIQQAEIFKKRMEEVGAVSEIVVRPRQQHGWATLGDDWSVITDWFDKHLLKKEK